ncbi:MAG: PTS glucose/sucrose transporter subunit IIB [Varibaculum sp.]|nr:PTS glucose/sucrose transporter subunit IIB [Varibaculum sp.]
MTQAAQLLAGLGGADNIDDLESCITRLRLEVADPQRVDEDALRAAGAFGVVCMGRSVQVVVGPVADTLAMDIEEMR